MRSLMIDRLVGRPWSPPPADRPRRRAVGVCRDYVLGDRAGSTRLEVVGLELVDVFGERAWRPDVGLQLLEQAGLGVKAVEHAREVGGVQRVEDQTVDAISDRLREPAELRDDERSPGRKALSGGQRSAVPPHGRQHSDVDITQQLTDLGWVEPAAERDRATAIQGAEALLELRRHLTDDPHVQRRGGQLRRLDQQLWPLVRVGRAEERDGQPLAGASGEAVTPDAFPDCGLVRHRLAHNVHKVWGVSGPEQRRAHRVGDRQDLGDPVFARARISPSRRWWP